MRSNDVNNILIDDILYFNGTSYDSVTNINAHYGVWIRTNSEGTITINYD